MIKFFRKIRYDLMGNNRTGKYLKYAIGEILLVVVGILIALQINNWNERRKQDKIEISALSEVRNDLVITLHDIDNNLYQLREYFNSAWKIKRLINTSVVFQDSLGSDLLNMTRDEFLYPSSKAYIALKSAGFKVIKDDEIRTQLDELYEVSFPRLQKATNFEPDLQAYFSDYTLNNFTAISSDTLYKSGKKVQDLSLPELWSLSKHQKSKYIPNDYDHFRKDPEFKTLLDNSINWRAMNLLRYRQFKGSTVQTIDMIEDKIKGKIKLSQIRNLSDQLEKENGIDQIIDIIKKGDTDDQGYDISERTINQLGYRLIREKKYDDALRILKQNTELYPDAFNTYDSYGEILLLTGDKENAIKAYEKTLELNPDNENAKKVLSEIK